MPMYSVIVPHHDDVERLGACIRSLLHQTVPRSHYEVIVVDNNSTQCLDGLLREFGEDIVLLREPRQGAAHARNCGLAAAGGARILFTDSDCTVADDWIMQLGSRLDQADVCGGRIVVTAADPRRRTATEWYESVFAFNQERYIAVKKFSATANLGLKREVADAVGGFTEGVSEDVDWCWRAVARGFELSYNRDAVVFHPARRNLTELSAKWRRITEQDIALRLSLGSPRHFLVARQAAVAFSPFIHLFRALAASGVPVRDRCGIVLVLFYIRAYRTVYGIQRLVERA
jgi:GT2 family glycosyltransferase